MKKPIYFLLLILINSALYSQDYQLNGNLGVGTNPDAKLDVDGDSKLRGDAEVEGDLKLSNESHSANVLENILFIDENEKVKPIPSTEDFLKGIYSFNCLEDANGYYPFWQGFAGWDYGRMILCDNSRLGVGLNNPAAKIHVNGSGIINDKLSIGTGEPQEEELFVSGRSLFQGPMESQKTGGDFWLAKNLNGESVYMLRANGSMKNFLQPGAPSAFEIFSEDNVEIFRLNKDGDLIMKLADDTKDPLSIVSSSGDDLFKVKHNGETFARKVTVQLGNFPDYVFEPDYELMTISDLKQYIQDNHRLPNMPSAEEVESQGADLGELNRKLVEKVEELTLYVIQLQDQLDQVQKESLLHKQGK